MSKRLFYDHDPQSQKREYSIDNTKKFINGNNLNINCEKPLPYFSELTG